MDYVKYIGLISEQKYVEATKYKNECIPSVLYKYYWLDENEEKNVQRFTTLENAQIYLSTLDQFNDPFEGNIFIFDETVLESMGWKKSHFLAYMRQINNHARICCFSNSDEKHQNMPMWAYYANDHKGFCVEYELTDEQKRVIYPVSYEKYRINGNVLIANILKSSVQMIKEGKDSNQLSGRLSAQMHMSYISLACKHSSWSHEKEFRALVRIEEGKYLPAVPSKIYIGMNCSEEHEAILLNIAKGFPKCEVYKMYSAMDNEEFLLGEKRLY